MRSAELQDLLEKKEVAVLDVRIDEKFEAGHIPNATHVPLEVLSEQLASLDKEETYYVVCTQGNRSQQAVDLLTEQGFNAVNVEGGMNEWTGDLEQ